MNIFTRIRDLLLDSQLSGEGVEFTRVAVTIFNDLTSPALERGELLPKWGGPKTKVGERCFVKLKGGSFWREVAITSVMNRLSHLEINWHDVRTGEVVDGKQIELLAEMPLPQQIRKSGGYW